MKLPKNTVIAQEKLTQYLLRARKRNDKSQWLAQIGYTLQNWRDLENDLKNQILSMESTLIGDSEYGKMFEIKGMLSGPNGKSLLVVTIWMIEFESKTTKFITMYPDKGRRR